MTRIEELSVLLFSQLEAGDWSKSTLELIEDAIGNAYEEGRQSVPSRITELEQALRLHLAVSPDDPLLVEPAEQEVVRLRARLEGVEQERDEFRASMYERINELVSAQARVRELEEQLGGKHGH